MSDFVYDLTSLNFPKADLVAMPGGRDPANYVNAADWNKESQAIVDLRTALRAGKWHGLVEQTTTPTTPASGTVMLFSRATPDAETPDIRTQLCALFADGSVIVICEGDSR